MIQRYCAPLGLAAVLTGATLLMPASAQAEPVIQCHDAAAKESQPASVQCDLRSEEEVTVGGVKVTADGRSIDATYKPYSDAEPPAMVMLLLEAAISSDDFIALRRAALQIADLKLKGVNFGFFTYAAAVDRIGRFGTPTDTVRRLLDGFDNPRSPRKQVPAPEILKSISDAIPMLAAEPGSRKFLVVLTAGAVTDTAYPVPEVSAKLKDAGITFVAIAPDRAAQKRTNAQPLRRLAEDTNGAFLTIPEKGAAKTLALLANGGTISFRPIAASMKIEADTGGAKPISLTYATKLEPDAAEVAKAAPTPSGPVNLSNPKEVYQALVAWLGASLQNQLMFGGGVLGIAALLGFLGVSASRRKRENAFADEHVPDAPAPVVSHEVTPVFGWLEFLDGNQTREPIRSRATRIGRSSDNDIVLKNETVHRQHAIIREDPTGGLVIVDMDTVNGVQVNGEPVKSAKLKQGDMIELGEVRMRFSQARAN